MKTTITHHEYLQLLGLALIAQRNVREVQEAIRAATELLGINPDAQASYEHIADELWGNDPQINKLLDRLGITIERTPTDPHPSPRS